MKKIGWIILVTSLVGCDVDTPKETTPQIVKNKEISPFDAVSKTVKMENPDLVLFNEEWYTGLENITTIDFQQKYQGKTVLAQISIKDISWDTDSSFKVSAEDSPYALQNFIFKLKSNDKDLLERVRRDYEPNEEYIFTLVITTIRKLDFTATTEMATSNIEYEGPYLSVGLENANIWIITGRIVKYYVKA